MNFRKLFSQLNDTAVVIATNDLVQAEAFCDNIAIMVNGRIVCYGPPEYLKHEYGRGLKVVLHSTDLDGSEIMKLCPFFDNQVEIEDKLVFTIKSQEGLLVSHIFESVRNALVNSARPNV